MGEIKDKDTSYAAAFHDARAGDIVEIIIELMGSDLRN